MANLLANDYTRLTEASRSYASGTKQLFIGGQWREPLSSQYFPTIDPSQGDQIAMVAAAGAQDIDVAVSAARRAFETGPWPKMRPHQREALMLRLADLINEHAQELAEIETLDSGRLLVNTRLFDVDLSVYTLRYMAGWATKLEGRTSQLSVPYLPDMEFSGFTVHEPIGVVGAITPWNVPLGQAVWKLAPVLATGCTLVLKPAEQTPLTALRLAQLCQEAGVPAGVINVVTGIGEVAGAALVEHPGIDKMSFTGSTAVGKLIAGSLAPRLKPYSLELGGKSPVIVTEDADLDVAIPGAAWAIYGNHGQNCCAGSRLYVHQSIFQTVMDGIAKIADSLDLGPGLAASSQMGPLVNTAHRDRVLGYVEMAVRDGGELLCGGRPLDGPGAYLKPTVLTGLPHHHAAVQEEIFGPVLVAFPYATLDEALDRANETQYGLGASVWTTRLDTVQRCFRDIRAGTVWINTHNVLDLALPFGGHKSSGVGQELGKEGVLSHTRIKSGIIRH